MAARRTVSNGPTEEEIQTQLFQLVDLHKARFPLLRWLHAIPNGGYRKPGEAGRFKAAGVKPGVPDLELPVAVRGYHSLRIEMKRGALGKVSQDQQEWIDGLRNLGHCVQVCHSLEAAWAAICWYLSPAFEMTPCAGVTLRHQSVAVRVVGTNYRLVANGLDCREAPGPDHQVWFYATHPPEALNFIAHCKRAGII